MALETLRQEVAAVLKAFDDKEEHEKEQEARWEREERIRNLPVECLRRGQVASEHLQTVTITVQGPASLGVDRSRYSIPANSDPLHEMFKGQDIEIRSI